MADDTDQIALIVKEILQQATQQGTQLSSQQIAEAVQQVMGSTQEKSNIVDAITQNKQEEINTGEAHRAAVFTDKEMWGVNKKIVTEREQKTAQISQDQDVALKALAIKDKELALAEREAKLRHQVKLDSIEVSEKENNSLVKHLANTLAVDFRTAAYHPISPNDSDVDAAKGKDK